MAFSMGASLAATLVVRNAQQRLPPSFRCCIFFCGGTAGDPATLAAQGGARLLSYASDGEVIGVPTAHVWGKNDPRNPDCGPVLSLLCRSQLRSIFVHEGGHEIPGSRDRVALLKAVECIRRTIDKALTSH